MKCKKAFCIAMAIALSVGAVPLGGGLIGLAHEGIVSEMKTQGRSFIEARKPLYGGYYRVWSDVKSGNEGKVTKMTDIPQNVDMVFAFYDYEYEKPQIAKALVEEYVPQLHERGQKVIGSIWVHRLCQKLLVTAEEEARIKEKYPNDQDISFSDNEKENQRFVDFSFSKTGCQKRAEYLIERYMTRYGFDGLDVDMEHYHKAKEDLNEYNIQDGWANSAFTRAEMQCTIDVFKEMGKIIGPKSNSEKLFIYDTNRDGEHPIFKETYDLYDYVLLQAYGQKPQQVDKTWQTFKGKISPEQFMLGFSFYEENTPKGGRWYDVPGDGQQDLKQSTAWQFAKWQPDQGVKGGLFSYALDRDGIPHPSKQDEELFHKSKIKHASDQMLQPTYKISNELVAEMKKADEYETITEADFPDEELRKDIIAVIGNYKGNIAKYDKVLELNNPKIKDLTGLEKMQNLKGLKLSNMLALETLVLRGLKLETLDFEGVETWKNVKKVDISGNRLDLTADTPETQVLMILRATAETNQADMTQDVKFDEQRPAAYPDPQFSVNPIKLETQKSASYDVKQKHLHGTKTVRGTDYTKLKDLTVEGIKVIASDYSIEDQLWNYDKYTAVVTDHAQNITDSFVIPQDKPGTYKVEIFDPQKQPVHTLIVEVGEAPKFLSNLAFHATVLGTSFDGETEQRKRVDSIFNNKIEELYNQQLMVGNVDTAWFAFDIGAGTVAERWEFFNNTAKKDGKLDFNAKSIRVEVLKNRVATAEELRDPQYLAKDENWQQVGEYKNGGELPKLTGEVDDLKDRYWRVVITEKNGQGVWSAINTLEFKILGERDYKVALRDLINSTVMVDTVDKEESTVKSYEAAKAEAEQVLAVDFENETVLKQAMTKLQETINALKDKEPKKADKTALQAALKKAKETDLTGKTEESIQTLQEAIGLAELLLDTDEAKQAELTNAAEALEQSLVNLKDKEKPTPQNKWELVGNDYFYYDENGQMVTNRWQGNYYLGSDGRMLRSTMTPDGYRVDATGKWVKGQWKSNKTGYWYEYEDGYYLTDTWKKIGRYWYHFQKNGYMSVSRWIGDQRTGYYYVNHNGVMLTSAVTPDGYTVDKSGKWDTSIPRK